MGTLPNLAAQQPRDNDVHVRSDNVLCSTPAVLQDIKHLPPVQLESISFPTPNLSTAPNENPLPAGLLERKLDGHQGPECNPAPQDPFRDVSPGLSLPPLTLD